MVIALTQTFLPMYLTVFLTATANTLEGLLSAATQLVTWLITTMGSFLGFVTENPVVLILFLIGLAGAGIGFLMRIWHSV